jgi:hypothetical protein
MDATNRRIYVAKDNEPDYRLFSVVTARGSLQSGVIRETDLAWCEGMTKWAPVSEVLKLVEGLNGINGTRHANGKTGNGTGAVAATQPAPDTRSVEPRTPVAKIAEASFQLSLSYLESYTNAIQELQRAAPAEQEIDFGHIWVELVYLGCCVVDQALQDKLEEEMRGVAVNLFRSHLYRVKVEGLHSFRPLKDRLLVYAQEAKTTRLEPADARIGKKFAIFCGRKDDHRVIKLGSTFYYRIYKAACEKIVSMAPKRK